MRPRSRNDNKGMSPKKLEGSTKSPDGLNMDEKAARAKKIDRAQLSAGRRKTLELMDSRLPGASKEKNEEKQGLLDLLDMMNEPVKKAKGGKMKTVKKMASGGNVCRGMGAATRGGNFVKG